MNDVLFQLSFYLFAALADTHTYPLLLTEASPRGETSIVLKEDDWPRLSDALETSPMGETPAVSENLGVECVRGFARQMRVTCEHVRGILGSSVVARRTGEGDARGERQCAIISAGGCQSGHSCLALIARTPDQPKPSRPTPRP